MNRDAFRVTRYPQGAFSWVDLSSTDAAASQTFLTELMGWDALEISLGEAAHEFYTMLSLEGANVAGMSQHSPEMMEQQIPSVWNSYITALDLDAFIPRITELGGTIVAGPIDIFDSGRMLMLIDPSGAYVSLWQPRSHIGAGLVNCPGAPVWNELLTTDRAASQAFYGALFGWQFVAFDEHTVEIRNQGRANAGLYTGATDLAHSYWRVYFAVADLDQSAAQVLALGGSFIQPIEQLDADHRRLLIRDPAGAEFGLLELAQPDHWVEGE